MPEFCACHPILSALAATIFTYFVTLLGAATVFFFRQVNGKILDLMMGFSAGVMTAAAFWSLLAPAISILTESGRSPAPTVSVGFILGGGMILLSDLFLAKSESGFGNSPGKRRIFLLASAVTMHNIPEGLAIGVAFGSVAAGLPGATAAGAVSLALGIGLQNFPEGACVSLPMRRSGSSRRRSFFCGQASGAVEPIAGVLGAAASLFVSEILPFALSFSAGAMIFVVCSELLPESSRQNKTLSSIGVMLGFAIMMILDISL